MAFFGALPGADDLRQNPALLLFGSSANVAVYRGEIIACNRRITLARAHASSAIKGWLYGEFFVWEGAATVHFQTL